MREEITSIRLWGRLRGALVLAGLATTAPGCGDGPICASDIAVFITAPDDGSSFYDGDDGIPGFQSDVTVRTNLRASELVELWVTDERGNQQYYSTTTDASGTARFEFLPGREARVLPARLRRDSRARQPSHDPVAEAPREHDGGRPGGRSGPRDRGRSWCLLPRQGAVERSRRLLRRNPPLQLGAVHPFLAPDPFWRGRGLFGLASLGRPESGARRQARDLAGCRSPRRLRGLLLFYSARVSLLGAAAGSALLLARPLRKALRRLALFALFFLGAWVVVAPVVPGWLVRPESFFHRMADSFSLYDPVTGLHLDVLKRVAGEPVFRTLSVFWPGLSPDRGADLADQGTFGAAMGPLEGILLIAGLLLALMDGWQKSVLPVVWLVVMLLGCGVFAQATPWYSRLVPVTLVAALLMGRAVDALVSLVPPKGLWRRLAAVAAAAAILLAITLPNVRRYVRFEEERPPTIYTAFRLEAGRLPGGTRNLCVAYERPDFTCQHPSFGPFVARPLTEDVSDPLDVLPVPPGRPTAFFIPFERFVPEARDPGLLVEEVRRFHPDATLVPTGTLPGDASRPLGVVVLVGAGKAVRGNG